MTKPIRVADYIARSIARQGTDTVFMLSGGMLMHLMDAIGRIPEVRYYCNFHEQACAMAADAYARESGKLGVCMATSGPGATNILTGLVGAYQDSVPVLFLTGQCKRRETVRGRGIKGLRQCGFLEVDIIPIVESVTKYAAFIDNPDDVRMHLEKAIHLATSGRPGPALLDVPLDVQAALVVPDELPGYRPEATSPPVQVEELNKVFQAVERARRPIILAGHGIRSAGLVAPFRSLIERWQVPVATSLMAKDLLPDEHPLFVGHPGPRANRGANFAVQSADIVISMGCSLHIQTVGYEGELFAPNALKVQIDVDPALLQREHIGAHWKFVWDLRDYLPMLLAKVQKPWGDQGSREWRSVCREWKQNYSSRNERHDLGNATDVVNLYEFVDVLSEELSGSETILTDAGQPHPILGQAFRPKGGQRYINAGSFAEMGFALPASFGVAVAAPAKTVVAVLGDGSLQTNIQELQTLVHHRFNVKLFVISNGGYASIRNTQRAFFDGFFVGSTPSSGVVLPNTERICRAYGLVYEPCTSRSVLRDCIRRTLSQEGPVLCEVMGQTDQRILPAVPSQLLPDGNMRSKALHEMLPAIEKSLAELTLPLLPLPPHPDLLGQG
jgi:acetolactate synthase-1/2/3 large subunit